MDASVTQRRASETVTESFSEELVSKYGIFCRQPRVAAAFCQRGQQSIRQSMSRGLSYEGAQPRQGSRDVTGRMEYETPRETQVHQSLSHLQLVVVPCRMATSPLQVSFGGDLAQKGTESRAWTWIGRNLWGNDIVKVKAVLSRVMPFYVSIC